MDGKTAVEVADQVKADLLISRKVTISNDPPTSATIDRQQRSEEVDMTLNDLLCFKGKDSFESSLQELRKHVLLHGLPSNVEYDVRAKVWKLLLGIPVVISVEEYIQKLEGECEWDKKIRDDTFRTFKSNDEFWSKINEPMMLRILNAISVEHGYVQGMNVLLGPFLLVMPELDSYYCFQCLLSRHIPRYVLKNLEGVHVGVALASKCLAILDPRLHAHIISKLRDMSIFSLRYIMTLLANMEPLSEVLKLWDAIFAFGVHFNVILFCSYLIQQREKLLRDTSAYG